MKKVFADMFSFVKVYFLPYKPLERDKKTWEEEFKNKKWNYLSDATQLSRYSIIVGYINFWFEGGSILDLGCGQGVLMQRLKNQNYKSYVGVDLSDEAIQLASQSKTDKDKFICSDINSYVPDQKFEFIVFNESLYYLENPLQIIEKYENYLAPDGKIIISMWENKERNNKLWREIDKKFRVIDGIRLKKIQTKSNWIIKVIERIMNEQSKLISIGFFLPLSENF